MWICCFTDHFVRSGPQVFAKWVGPRWIKLFTHPHWSQSVSH